MSIYLDKLAHVQVIINCQYSIAPMCTREDTHLASLRAPSQMTPWVKMNSYQLNPCTTDIIICIPLCYNLHTLQLFADPLGSSTLNLYAYSGTTIISWWNPQPEGWYTTPKLSTPREPTIYKSGNCQGWATHWGRQSPTSRSSKVKLEMEDKMVRKKYGN